MHRILLPTMDFELQIKAIDDQMESADSVEKGRLVAIKAAKMWTEKKKKMMEKKQIRAKLTKKERLHVGSLIGGISAHPTTKNHSAKSKKVLSLHHHHRKLYNRIAKRKEHGKSGVITVQRGHTGQQKICQLHHAALTKIEGQNQQFVTKTKRDEKCNDAKLCTVTYLNNDLSAKVNSRTTPKQERNERDKQLKKYFRDKNKLLQDVGGGGNCFYHCVSMIAHECKSHHLYVRRFTADWIEKQSDNAEYTDRLKGETTAVDGGDTVDVGETVRERAEKVRRVSDYYYMCALSFFHAT